MPHLSVALWTSLELRDARESLRMDWMRCRLGHVVTGLEPMEPMEPGRQIRPFWVCGFRGSGSRDWRHQEGDGDTENGMKMAIWSEDEWRWHRIERVLLEWTKAPVEKSIRSITMVSCRLRPRHFVSTSYFQFGPNASVAHVGWGSRASCWMAAACQNLGMNLKIVPSEFWICIWIFETAILYT